MKQLFLLFLFIITAILPTNAHSPGDIITLDLSNPSSPSSFDLNNKGYWIETYSNDHPTITFDPFSFTHLPGGEGGTDVGGGMSYWDGFTYCTNGDTEDYGMLGNSDGWVANQWGCMAGGGIKTDAQNQVIIENGKVAVEQGIPYLVAYWGYWMEMNEGREPCLQVNLAGETLYEPIGVYINNHPWPYYGNIHGDGFARPFENGDFFKLYIHGLNEYGEDIGNPVEYTLARMENGQLIQSPDWEWVNLSSLGKVSGFYFTMETSDYDPIYGPNTAVYFCLDKLQVKVPEENSGLPSRPTNLQANSTETSILFSWNPSTDNNRVVGYNIYLDNTFVARVIETNYTFEELLSDTSYQLGVEAIDDEGNPSDRATIKASTTDETPPTMPSHLTATPSTTTIFLSWTASEDNVAVTGYNIYLNGQREKRVTETSHTLTLLDPSTTYTVEVEALDAAGNRSEKANIQVTTRSENTGLFILPENQDATSREPIHIYNLSGQYIRSIQATTNNTNPISDLPPGIYFVKQGKTIKKVISGK